MVQLTQHKEFDLPAQVARREKASISLKARSLGEAMKKLEF